MHPDRTEVAFRYAGQRSDLHSILTLPIFSNPRDPAIGTVLNIVNSSCGGCQNRDQCEPSYSLPTHINDSAVSLAITGKNTWQEGCRVPQGSIALDTQAAKRLFAKPIPHLRR